MMYINDITYIFMFAAPDRPDQEGDVTSSNSSILATELFGSLLFEVS